MIQRIQIRAVGPTIKDVDEELKRAADAIAAALHVSLVAHPEQVIEGSPSDRLANAFQGRLTFSVTTQWPGSKAQGEATLR